jgi:ergothioneine biosynthesis protein EgtC
MCRLLGYLGPKIELDKILFKPEHSLIVQSYQPKEMTSGLLNADGFGIGWYHPEKESNPYTYRNILPIWSDINLIQLSRYIESNCILAYVRSATPGLAVDLSNCQPFTKGNIMFIHNGFIANFRNTLYRPIRNLLDDTHYKLIHGTTDSEHIFALIMQYFDITNNLKEAVKKTLEKLTELATEYHTDFSANIIISDGKKWVVSRYATRKPVPSLYYLRDDLLYPDSMIVASEPLFEGNWHTFDENIVI